MRTWHLPWSPHNERDDHKLADTSCFNSREVVVTEKMDGENTTLYRDHLHARSLDSANHPSRTWIKNLHSSIAHLIPEGMRICGENLYAIHTLEYDNLPSYFMVFNIWIDDLCLSWNDTLEYCDMLSLKHVPVLDKYIWSESMARKEKAEDERIRADSSWGSRYQKMEGVVVRVTDAFGVLDWTSSIAKYVRPNHIQTGTHWMDKEVEPNGLASK